MGLELFLMIIVVTLAVSCAFMLPVATLSNAVSFAPGGLPTKNIILTGI